MKLRSRFNYHPSNKQRCIMKKRLAATMVGTLFIFLLAAFAVPAEVEVGKPVPDFTLKGIDGKSYQLSQFKGKVVVLEWTNPNCPFVQRVYKEIMPGVQKKYADKVVWLTVNSTNPNHQDFETAEDLMKKYQEWHAQFLSMLLDPYGKVGKMFDAKT